MYEMVSSAKDSLSPKSCTVRSIIAAHVGSIIAEVLIKITATFVRGGALFIAATKEGRVNVSKTLQRMAPLGLASSVVAEGPTKRNEWEITTE